MHFRVPLQSISIAAAALCLSKAHVVSSERTTGTELIKDGIITRTDISHLASITEGIQRMYDACDENDFTTAYEMYKGKHYSKYSLKEIATLDQFKNTGLSFAFQMYGLTDGKFDQFQDKTPYTNFADINIEKLLKAAEGDADGVYSPNCELAATAAVWQVLYMQAHYELWGAMQDCSISGDPNYNNEAAGLPDHNAKADEFIAYWVGSLEDTMDSDSGYSPFSASNDIATYFGTISENGISYANEYVIEGYESLSALLSNDDACDLDTAPSTLASMWKINTQITPYMMIPLIQNLIKSMIDKDQPSIDVYSSMVIPQLVQCRRSDYEYLKENLSTVNYDERKLHTIMKALQDSYDCLGIACEDIGGPADLNDSHLSCKDSHYRAPNLAGYPATTDVREETKLDLDIHQMNILMSYDSEHYWTLAKNIYLSGKNSVEQTSDTDDDFLFDVQLRSLHSLAKSQSRIGTLFYDEILNYNNDDPYYADALIKDIFNNESHNGESKDVKAAIIYNVIVTQILYVNILSKMKDAVSTCQPIDQLSNRNNRAGRAWDEVAAYIIGSLEGSTRGGADDFTEGVSLWSLGNRRGIEFNRQNMDGYAISNAAVQNLLLSGKGQIRHFNCDHLERTSTNIAHMLLIPMIQTMVKYAISNQLIAWNSGEVEVYEGEIYARFLIPIYNKFSKTSAATLQKNMIRNFNSLVGDGPQAVADAFLDIADDIGIQCEFVGRSFEVDACLNYTPTLKERNERTSSSDASTMSYNWMVAGTSASLVMLLFSIL